MGLAGRLAHASPPPGIPLPSTATSTTVLCWALSEAPGSTSAFRRNGIIDRRGDFAAAQRPPGRSRGPTRGPRRSSSGGPATRSLPGSSARLLRSPVFVVAPIPSLSSPDHPRYSSCLPHRLHPCDRYLQLLFRPSSCLPDWSPWLSPAPVFCPWPLRAASGACDYAFESQVPEVARGRLEPWASIHRWTTAGRTERKSSDAPFAAVGMTEDQIERQSQRRAAAVACRHFGPCQPLLADDISGAQRGGTASDHFQP